MAEKQQQNRPGSASQPGSAGSPGISTQSPSREQQSRRDDASNRDSRQGQHDDGQREGKFSPQDEDTEIAGREHDFEEIEERDEDDEEKA